MNVNIALHSTKTESSLKQLDELLKGFELPMSSDNISKLTGSVWPSAAARRLQLQLGRARG